MVEISLLVKNLRSALEAAQAYEFQNMAELIEVVHAKSYELSSRHAAYLIREACVLVKRIEMARDTTLATMSAQASIQRIEAVATQEV